MDPSGEAVHAAVPYSPGSGPRLDPILLDSVVRPEQPAGSELLQLLQARLDAVAAAV